ncbi:hypothetical protein BKA00_006212 [Actinomadura coerulea]|uniref:Uncharacterized protein n=1 Tax=Actinomadura coerulea TaxID=46159 RepID=A0A7X0G4J6_9ACTN|nr:hypothetical protein [Actinomadura coerulea]MBB6399298.1 hypothetical protein [Actinomadura coerulea]GGQ27927.1 hypothetical protein GCM10010187_50710 [Actinomadura coerulea]
MTETSDRLRDLTGEASLNHVVLGPAGSIGVEGRLAEDACSRDALHALAAGLGLTGLRRDRLADDLARAAASSDADSARSAAAVLHAFGTRLGALIATLRDPATAARQGSTPYRRDFLARWTTVERVWLAGGLLAGACGPLVLEGARATAGLAPHPCPVALPPRPELAPLIGAARHLPASSGTEAAVVADLGHTSIRTAVAERHGRTLRRLRHLRAGPAPRLPGTVESAVGAALAEAVRDVADPTAKRIRVIVSVASFVRDGLPADDGQGIYGCLAAGAPALLRAIRDAAGVGADLRFLHDGTAAASAAGGTGDAVITAGTWLGVGFAPMGGPPRLTVPRDRLPVAWADEAGPPPDALG